MKMRKDFDAILAKPEERVRLSVSWPGGIIEFVVSLREHDGKQWLELREGGSYVWESPSVVAAGDGKEACGGRS